MAANIVTFHDHNISCAGLHMPAKDQFLGIKCRFEPVDIYSALHGRFVDGGFGCFDLPLPSPYHEGKGGGVTIDGCLSLDWSDNGTLTSIEAWVSSRNLSRRNLPDVRGNGNFRAILNTDGLRQAVEARSVIETREGGILDFRFVDRDADRTVKLGDFIWALVADDLLIGFRFDFRPLM